MSDRKDGGDDDYTVGYGRPPKETRFKPGQSGNPMGRKRKSKSRAEKMRAQLNRKVSVKEGGVTKRIPFEDAIMIALTNRAVKGDLKAASFVFALSEALEKAETDPELSPEEQMILDEFTRYVGGEGLDMQSGCSDAEPPATPPVERDADD